MAQNYTVGLHIQYPSGTNLANVNATLRNESTNESQTLTTNSSGEVVWNVANLTSGFVVGDKITVFSLYQGFAQSFSFTIPATGQSTSVKDNSNVSVGTATGGGLTGTLVLVTVSTAPSLRYFTVQDFLDYFDLKEYNADNENGVKPQRIVLMGTSVELSIDNDTRTKFDSNSGAYYSVSSEYHDARYQKQSDYFLINTPLNAITKFEINVNAEETIPNFVDLQFTQIDDCEATTGWTASADGSVTLNTTNGNPNQGDGCLNLVKSGTTGATVTYSKTFNSFDFTTRSFYVDFFINATSSLASSGTAVEIRIGTNSSNYFSRTYTANDIQTNLWTPLGMIKSDTTNVTTTGTPTPSALTYFAILVTLSAASTTIAAPNMRLDDLRMNLRNRINIDTSTGRVHVTNSIDLPTRGKRHARATYTYGRSSVPVDIKELAIIDTGNKMLGSAFVRQRIGYKSDKEMASLDWFMNYRDRIINKYRMPQILPT